MKKQLIEKERRKNLNKGKGGIIEGGYVIWGEN